MSGPCGIKHCDCDRDIVDATKFEDIIIALKFEARDAASYFYENDENPNADWDTISELLSTVERLVKARTGN